MKPETSTKNNPIGLYKDPQSGAYIGALEEAQADAYVRNGFQLVQEGEDAAKMSAKAIAELDKNKES